MTDPVTVKVLPLKDSALKLVHPTHGPLAKDGALWPLDTVTARAITHGHVKVDEADHAEDSE